MVFSPSGLSRIYPTPAPSLDLDPSKYNDQNEYLSTVLFIVSSAILTHLDVSLCEKISI